MSFVRSRCRGLADLGNGQMQDERAAAAGCAGGGDASAHGFGDILCEWQAEASAVDLRCSGRGAAIERLGGVLEFARSGPRAAGFPGGLDLVWLGFAFTGPKA